MTDAATSATPDMNPAATSATNSSKPAPRILVTGAAGFLGSAIVREALARGLSPRAFVRREPATNEIPLPARAIHFGDLTAPETMPAAVADADAIVHCAAATSASALDEALARRVNVEGTAALLRAAEAESASRASGGEGTHASGHPIRWIQISSMSAHPRSTSVYGRTKLAADEEVRRSSLPWTILRPAILYGPGDRGLMSKTLALMEKLPVIPVVGNGRQSVRPAFVGDVARAALDCLAEPRTVGGSYMLGSLDDASFDDFLRELARSRGLRRPLIHLPIPVAMLIARALGAITSNPPLTADNVLGVKEATPIDIDAAVRDFGYAPLTFAEGLARTRAGGG